MCWLVFMEEWQYKLKLGSDMRDMTALRVPPFPSDHATLDSQMTIIHSTE